MVRIAIKMESKNKADSQQLAINIQTKRVDYVGL